MKKFTLLLIATFFAVVGFAQKPLANAQRVPDGVLTQKFNANQALNGIARNAQRVPVGKKRAGAELVTPPTGVEAKVFYTVGGKFYVNGQSGWSDATTDMKSVNVVVDGTDIYIQRLAYWFLDGWIKGTLDGTVATFESGQFIGEDEYGAEYLVGSDDGSTVSDIVFEYDSEAGTLTARTSFIVESSDAESVSAYCYWSSPVFSVTEPEAPEVVVLPDGVEVEAYVMSYTNRSGDAGSTPVNVAVDGNDVYFQGLSSYIPKAWVLGTKDGNTITFPAMQYLGTYSGYESYAFYTGDAVFTYDADADTYSAEGTIFNVLGDQYYDGYYTNPVLSKVVEKAATPADPEITDMADGNYGWYITFNVPLVDVNGDALVADKLSYMLYTDVEGVVAPLTFTPDTHSRLTEEMTEIPYGFTENWDFYDTQIYLNDLYSEKWNKIGIQSIYYGGDEENATEIQWFEIKPYSIQTVTFDFNAMDVPTSSGSGVTAVHDGDITETQVLTEDNVTLAISPKEEGKPTDNRYWSTMAGPQLRVYSGTLTFSTPFGYAVKEIVFNTIKWNDGNSFDSGEFNAVTTTEDNNTIVTVTWTGEAQEVLLSVAGNTQINSINVTIEAVEPAPVEVPEGLETEAYLFNGFDNNYETEVSKPVEVGIDAENGNVYIQGLSESLPEAWVVGKLNGTTLTIPQTYLGVYESWLGTYELIFSGATFAYDEEAGTFTSVEGFTSLDGDEEAWDDFSNVILTKVVEVAGTPATPVITDLRHSSSYGYSIKFDLPLVDTEGHPMLASKLYWRLVSEVNGEQAVVTLSTDDYPYIEEDMTEVPYGYSDSDEYDIYDGTIWLNMAEAYDWDRVGIQAIYYGGDEENVSEIAWVTLKTRKTITLDAKGYATFCDGVDNYYVESEDATAYALTVDNAKGWRVVFSEIDEVPVKTGALIKGEPNAEVVLATTPFEYKVSANDLIAAVEDVTDFAEGTLVLGIANGQSGFFKFAGQVIPAGKAYLAPIPEAGDSKLYLVFGDEEVTGINTVEAPVNSDSRIYNLNGQRVNKAQKGVYIINGKKVVLK